MVRDPPDEPGPGRAWQGEVAQADADHAVRAHSDGLLLQQVQQGICGNDAGRRGQGCGLTRNRAGGSTETAPRAPFGRAGGGTRGSAPSLPVSPRPGTTPPTPAAARVG